jgi:hypothetical protein
MQHGGTPVPFAPPPPAPLASSPCEATPPVPQQPPAMRARCDMPGFITVQHRPSGTGPVGSTEACASCPTCGVWKHHAAIVNILPVNSRVQPCARGGPRAKQSALRPPRRRPRRARPWHNVGRTPRSPRTPHSLPRARPAAWPVGGSAAPPRITGSSAPAARRRASLSLSASIHMHVLNNSHADRMYL